MKKNLLLIAVICFVLPVLGQNNFNEIKGKWSYSVDAGGTYMTGVFHFFENNGTLTGEIQSAEGYVIPFSKVEQKEENVFYLEAKTEYDLYKITVKINDDKFSGTGTSYQGEAPITGERKKE